LKDAGWENAGINNGDLSTEVKNAHLAGLRLPHREYKLKNNHNN
jgi:hypothetical protein